MNQHQSLEERAGPAHGYDAHARAKALEGSHPRDVLAEAVAHFDAVALSFSGAEDVVLIDMLGELGGSVPIFCLDTGRLHAETLAFIERVRTHYDLSIELVRPDAAAVDAFVRRKGAFSFYEDGHQECCGIRKIEPLRHHLVDFDAWITGQRRDQSPTRRDVPVVQQDTALTEAPGRLIKFNPLAAWTSADVWTYIRERGVPYNALHDRGYRSIGCEPCTRAVRPDEHERAGRWWWEEATQKECGLHADNLDADARIIARGGSTAA